jgi:flagellar biosynthesis protein FlhF
MSETLTAEASEVRTYRGSSIEELLPQIRAELGANAVILCQREGLVGGVGGFFQKRCVEVEARAGAPGIDVYDEDPARDEGSAPRGLSPEQGGAAGEDVLDPPAPVPPTAATSAVDAGGSNAPGEGPGLDSAVEFEAVPEPLPVRNDAATREGLSTPAVQELVRQARPFAEMLEGAGAEVGDEPADEASAEASTAPLAAGPREPRAAAGLRDGLVGSGIGADLAGEIVDAVVASALPFANSGRLRTLVRDELALRVPVALAAAPGRRTIAVVGPAGAGKTAAIAGIAAAHAGVGKTVVCLAVAPSDGGAALESMLAEADVLVACVAVKELGNACGGKAAQSADDDGLAGAVACADLILIDTPAAWAGADGLAPLGKALKAATVDETHLALRAGAAAAVGAELAAGLASLRPDRLLLTGAAETAHVGGALDVAIRCELPLGYVADGPDSIAPADARALTSRVTP